MDVGIEDGMKEDLGFSQGIEARNHDEVGESKEDKPSEG